jgi:hypothetical protein
VFVDEMNTANCLGLISEAFSDHSMDGVALPVNLFFVGAINPFIKNDSPVHQEHLGVNDDDEYAMREFIVRPLPPSLSLMTHEWVSFNSEMEQNFLEAYIKKRHLAVYLTKVLHWEQFVRHGPVDCAAEISRAHERDWGFSASDSLWKDIVDPFHKIAVNLIVACQRILNDYSRLRLLLRVRPSIRDMLRCANMWQWILAQRIPSCSDAQLLPKQDSYVNPFLPQDAWCIDTEPGLSYQSIRMYTTKRLRQALYAAVAICYYIRLPATVKDPTKTNTIVQLRLDFLEKLQHQFKEDHDLCPINFVQNWTDCFDHLWQYASKPLGIAHTTVLKENFYTVVVALHVKPTMPLLITGPAGALPSIFKGCFDFLKVLFCLFDASTGCGKTLSFKLASDNLIGASQSNHFLFQNLSKILVSSYQCSESTSASEVSSLFKRAEDRQSNLDRYQAKALSNSERCCVFLDEVGLPKEKRQALKAMHDVLDNGKGVPVVLLSNKNLDAAKMSRCLQVMQTQPSQDDLLKLALGLLYDNKTESSLELVLPVSEEEKRRIHGLCTAFSRINSLIPDERGFHSRDFVYLLKYLRRSLVAQQSGVRSEHWRVHFDASTLLEALRRNFQTVNPANFSIVANEFLLQCGLRSSVPSRHHEKDLSPTPLDEGEQLHISPQVLNSLKASVEDSHPDADPTTAPFRHTLLIDRSNCESAIDLLFSMNILDPGETKVLAMPSNDIDQNSVDISEALRQVKTAAENGFTMLLVNGDALYSALYDLLNKYYNSGGGNEYFCNINLGNVSSPVSVHSKFKLIVCISAEKAQTAPLPFLNRFSKFALSFRDALQDRVEYYTQVGNVPSCFGSEPVSNIKLLFKGLVEGGEHFAEFMGGSSALYGFLRDETVPALCLKFLLDGCNCSMRTFRIECPLQCAGHDEHVEQHSEGLHASFYENHASRDLKSRMPELIRALNFHILQLARPESVFNLRSRLPLEYKQEYFRQEHFSFANVVRSIMSLPWDGTRSCIKLTAFTRTNTAIKMLQTSKRKDALMSLFHADEVATVAPGQRIALSDSSFVCIICSEAYVDCSQVWKAIQDVFNECSRPAFASGKSKLCSKALLVIFDMSIHTSSFVSFIRRKVDEGIEQMQSNGLPADYRLPAVIFLVHIPPELLKARASYNALATNNWVTIYTDTFGVEQSDLNDDRAVVAVDARRWLQVAFGLSTQPVAQTVHRELGGIIFDSIREALKGGKISCFQEIFLRKNVRNGVTKSLPAYKERIAVKAADWICNEVLTKRPYLKVALLDNYAAHWSALLENLAIRYSSKLSSGQTVSVYRITVSSCFCSHCAGAQFARAAAGSSKLHAERLSC